MNLTPSSMQVAWACVTLGSGFVIQAVFLARVSKQATSTYEAARNMPHVVAIGGVASAAAGLAYSIGYALLLLGVGAAAYALSLCAVRWGVKAQPRLIARDEQFDQESATR